nr:prohead protease/major capsid protein fusion protein [Bradyrhizobium frederickii]
MLRRDLDGDYFEILSITPKAIRLDRLKSGAAPVLDSHRTSSTRDQIGIVTDTRIEGGRLIADAQLSPRDDVKGIAADLAAGTSPNVSVGYRVHASVEGNDPQGRRTVTVTDWEPFEISLVAIPADPNTHIRHMEITSMDDENQIDDTTTTDSTRSGSDHRDQDSRRALEFYEIAARHRLPAEFARGHITAGSTVREFRLAALNERAAIASRVTISSRSGDENSATLDNPDFLARSIEGALVARMTGQRPEGASAELMGRTLLDMGAMLVQARGERPAWGNRDRLASQVMERSMGGMLATSDFPNLLTTSGNRVLNEAYRTAQTPLMGLAKRRDAVDFRALTTIKLSEAPRLSEVKEGGEVTHGSRSEAKESFKLKTYAKIFSLSRQAIINDDLGAFADSNAAFGRAAAQTEADLLVSLLTANSGNGVNLDDGNPLYGTGATRGNKAAAGAAINITTLNAARQALRGMKDIDGKTPINVTPKHLVVGPAKETEAEQFLATTLYPNQNSAVNPFAGKILVSVDPRLTGNAWRLFADPAEIATIMVAYLNGADGPMVETRLGWDVLGLEVRAVLDFGCGVNDFRGTYLNPGD